MSSIDNRIVNMQFNNKGFESGVATTIDSLKKLNESLKMKDSGKGLEQVGTSMRKLSDKGMGALGASVTSVTEKFSVFSSFVDGVFENLGGRAADLGMKLIKSLSFEPITTGFSEYETKMNAISTILANTADDGKTLEDVSAALNELNKYADDTIYNFAQMTENIGRFTAAGVSLEDSVASIKGLSNLAAFFGVDATRASSAMYQMSQALAAGKVSLQDWNSMVNSGMSGEAFQNALIRTSELMGTGAKKAIESYGSFRESLTKGAWLTSEVMVETLKQISGAYKESELREQGYTATQAKAIVDMAKRANEAATEVRTITGMIDAMKESVQSGWAISWEHIIGDKEEATKLLTGIKDAFESVLNPISDARNEMLSDWSDLGGRDAVIKGLANTFQSLGKILGSVRDAFREVFPAMTGEQLTAISKGFENFTEKLKVSDSTAQKIKETFKGLFSVLKIVADAIGSVFSIMGSGASILGVLGNGLLTATSTLGRYLTGLQEGIDESKVFEKATEGVKKGIESVGKFFTTVGEGISSFFKSFGDLSIVPVFKTMLSVTEQLGGGLAKVFEGMGESIGKIDLNKFVVALTALAGRDIFKTIKESVSGLRDVFKSFNGLGNGIVNILDGVGNSLKAYQEQLHAGTLIKIAGAIAIMAGSLLLLSSIKPGEMESGLIGMTTLIVELMVGLALLSKAIGGMKFMQLNGLSTALLALSTALLLMATALKKLSDLSMDQIATGLAGVGGSMLILVAGVKLMDGASKGLTRTATSMVVLAAALIVMAEAVQRFGQINPEEMLKGLAGVGAALVELGLFTKLTSANQMSVLSSTGLLILASALLVFQNAVAKFGEMDVQTIITGLASVGAMLLELAVFTKLASGANGMLTTSAAMVVMAASINLMVPAFKSLASLSWDEIIRGLTSLAASLTVLGVASKLMSGGQLAAVGAGLGVMSAALIVLGGALHLISAMSWEEIAKGLVTLAGSLTIFAVAMNAMSTGLVGAAAMTVMAAAMALFTPQLIMMAKLSWGEIAAGLAMLAGAFTVIGVAGALLTPLAPVIAALAASVALLGVACIAAGAGVALFATGMAALAGVGAAGGYAIAEILRQLISLLPKFATACGQALVEFAKAVGEGMPALAKAFGQMIIGLCDAIVQAVPAILKAGLELLTALCEVLLEGGPKLIEVAVKMVIALAEGLAKNATMLVNAGIDLILQLLNALAAKAGELIQAGIDLAVALINGLADGIRNNVGPVKEAIKNLGQALIDAFKELLGIHSPSTVFNGLGINIIEGLVQGIGSKVGEVINKMKTLATDMINAIKSKLGEFLTAGGNLISNLANGIKSKVSTVTTNIKNMMTTAISNIKSKFGEFTSSGSTLITNLSNGIKAKASGVATAVKNAINSAKSAASSLASSFKSVGTNLINGLSSGIKSMASKVASAAKSVVQGAVNAAKKALKIKSPSRVFMQIGDYSVQGLVKGLEDSAYTVDDSATGLAQRVINGVSGTISSISSALQGEINTEMVIAPVMDLSNVEEGSKTIRELMNNSNVLAMNADVTGSMTRSMGSIQNGTNDRLLAAIKDLKDNVGNNSTTYQINGITYDDGSNVQSAIETLIRATTIERRI